MSAVMTREIAAYTPTAAAVAGLRAKYERIVFDLTKPGELDRAKDAYKEINAHSMTLEAARVKEKAESLAYGRFVDSEARRIADELDRLRLPIKEQIESETKREQREREAAVQREKERLDAEARAKREAEEMALAEQRTELARKQAEIDAREKESRDRIAAQEREARERQAAADAERRAAEELAAKARRDAEEIERKARAEQEAREKAERDRVEAAARAKADAERKVREAAEAKAKAERDKKEAVERESRRAAAELLDAQGMLDTFVKRYGHLKRFAPVVKAIKSLHARA